MKDGSAGAVAQQRVYLLNAFALRPVALAAFLIVGMWAANLRWGFRYVFGVFWSPPDVFADFIKLVLSYPGHPVHQSVMPELIEKYSVGHEADLSGLIFTRPEAIKYTHFQMPPLTTTIGVLCRMAVTAIDPVWLFAGLALGIEAYLLAIALKIGRDWPEKIALACIVTLAFSNSYMLLRGNLYAGLCCVLLIHYLLSLRTRPALAGILLAIACNIRPNAIVFALPAFALGWPTLRRYGVVLATSGVAIFAVFLVVAHAFYPDYSLATFRTGLSIYNHTYAAGNEGIIGGSALFSPLKLMFGYGPAAAISLILAAFFALLALLNRRAERSVVAFLICASYTSLTVVFGDYYLTVFAAVPILATTDQKTWRVWLATIASALVLAPMLYGYWWSYPVTVFLRPMLIATASFGLTAMSIRPGSRTQTMC